MSIGSKINYNAGEAKQCSPHARSRKRNAYDDPDSGIPAIEVAATAGEA